jgi:hypothetical protein
MAAFAATVANHLIFARQHLCLQSTFWAFDDEFRHQDDDFRHRPGLPNFRHSVYVQFFLGVLGQQLVVVCNPYQGLA